MSALGEFDLIAAYFTRPVQRAVLGVGDDCALLAPGHGMQMAISSDMLVEGRHFLSTVAPDRLGHKALAVNLSDLAACGARPVAFTLALSMPRVDEAFLAGFSRGLLALADAHGCELVGGDTTQGPLNICITVFGEVPAGQALLRSGARAGDHRDLHSFPTRRSSDLAAHQLAAVRIGQRQQAFRKSRQPGLVDPRQCQRQREGQGFGTAGSQVAQVDGQRLVAQRERVHVREEMPALDQHVAGNRQLRSGRGLQQRAIVAHAQRRARGGAREVACDQVKFTHGAEHTGCAGRGFRNSAGA